MPSSEHLKFAHRFNPDGTVDSICPRCFVTVAFRYKRSRFGGSKKSSTSVTRFWLPVTSSSKKMPRSETVSEPVSRDQKASLMNRKSTELTFGSEWVHTLCTQLPQRLDGSMDFVDQESTFRPTCMSGTLFAYVRTTCGELLLYQHQSPTFRPHSSRGD